MNQYNFLYADAVEGLIMATASSIFVGVVITLIRFLILNWLERRAGS